MKKLFLFTVLSCGISLAAQAQNGENTKPFTPDRSAVASAVQVETDRVGGLVALTAEQKARLNAANTEIEEKRQYLKHVGKENAETTGELSRGRALYYQQILGPEQAASVLKQADRK